MNSFVACFPIGPGDEGGQAGAVMGTGATVGVAIKDAASNLNAQVAARGGYVEPADSVRMLVAVFEAPEGISQVRAEFAANQMKMIEVTDREGEPRALRPVLVMMINPVGAATGDIIV